MVNTYPDLVFGYSVVWGLISFYVLYLGFKISKLEKDKKD